MFVKEKKRTAGFFLEQVPAIENPTGAGDWTSRQYSHCHTVLGIGIPQMGSQLNMCMGDQEIPAKLLSDCPTAARSGHTNTLNMEWYPRPRNSFII